MRRVKGEGEGQDQSRLAYSRELEQMRRGKSPGRKQHLTCMYVCMHVRVYVCMRVIPATVVVTDIPYTYVCIVYAHAARAAAESEARGTAEER